MAKLDLEELRKERLKFDLMMKADLEAISQLTRKRDELFHMHCI